MAALTGPERKELDTSDYAIPEKAPGPDAYPIPDEMSARSALSRVESMGTESEKGRVQSAVKRKFPNIDVGGADSKRREAMKRAVVGGGV